MVLSYPVTGSEDIHNYVQSGGAEMDRDGTGWDDGQGCSPSASRRIVDGHYARVFNDERVQWRCVT